MRICSGSRNLVFTRVWATTPSRWMCIREFGDISEQLARDERARKKALREEKLDRCEVDATAYHKWRESSTNLIVAI